jgi:tRNA (guanine-N7-)-methyltransferase
MAPHGRPTPQADGRDETERPRFVDLLPEQAARPDANPYLTLHREFGLPLLPGSEAWRWRGRWHEHFGRKAPLTLEIGCGNGFFLSALAARHPDHNHVGVEIRYKRTVLVARKLQAAGVSNARILRYDASFLDDLFLPGSLSCIWVNHPDPWPKARHEKNRLISRWFLEDVVQLLKPGGFFRLKSDFEDNIGRVPGLLSSDGDGGPMPTLPLRVTGRSEDVITGPAPWPDDIETNYQSKFRKRGEPVFAIELQRTE